MGLKEKGLETVTDLVKNNVPKVLGMLFPYFGLEKKAFDTYEEEIKKSNLDHDIKAKLILTAKSDLKRWKNQESIAEIAFNEAKDGTDFSEKSGVNEEWLERFMDAAKFVSSEEMQLIWGKILAGEFEEPGSTPRNMIRILSEMTPELAHAFQKICSMKVRVRELKENGQADDEHVIIIAPYYFCNIRFEKLGITFRILNELDTLGVIKFSPKSSYRFPISDQSFLMYAENRVEIAKSYDRYHELHTGRVMLTAAGEALSNIIEPVKIEGYHDMIIDYWKNCSVIFANIDDYIIEEKDGKITVTKKNET